MDSSQTVEKFRPNARQQDILDIIRQTGFAETESTARQFAKTTQTIRRDFKELEAHGFVSRVHGGAKANLGHQNRPYDERKLARAEEKQAIGLAAAERIPEGRCVFLSLGTSTEAVARNLLTHRDMQFVTNNLNIAQLLRGNESAEIQVCGGVIRHEDGGMLDPRAIDMIRNLRMDYCVIGIGAISDDGGLYCYSINEVETAQALIQQSQNIILVADEKKIGRQANHRMGHLEDVDMFVTDKILRGDIQQLCGNAGVELVIAER